MTEYTGGLRTIRVGTGYRVRLAMGFARGWACRNAGTGDQEGRRVRADPVGNSADSGAALAEHTGPHQMHGIVRWGGQRDIDSGLAHPGRDGARIARMHRERLGIAQLFDGELMQVEGDPRAIS